jgi:urease accessory protein
MVMVTITSITITPSTVATIMLTTTKPKRKSRKREEVADTGSHLSCKIESASSGIDQSALYRLMTWLSPSFPIGAFSYSSGLEWAVEAGDIVSAATLQDWLAAMLTDGAGFCDSVLLAHAHRHVASGNQRGLIDLAELAAALLPSRERQLETMAQGRAFIDATRASWTCDVLEIFVKNAGQPLAYPVAVGIVSAAHGISLPLTLHAFLHAMTANWISAASRLVPLGQTDSQRTLAALEPIVVATGDRALKAQLDDLGSATFRADLASMQHETQYTRLFRS